MPIRLTKGDQNYYIKFRVLDGNAKPMDLSSKTITFKARLRGSSILKITGACEEISPEEPLTAGFCCYFVKEGDFDTAGLYDAELEITNVSGEILTAPGIEIVVVDDLP